MSPHRARPVAVLQPGQVAVFVADRALTHEQANDFTEGMRRRGIEAVIVSGASLVGVCNIRPWKIAR